MNEQCNCHTGSARNCPIHTQADFDAADRAIGRGPAELRNDEAIRADLARKAELRAAFRRRLEEVKAGKRGGLIDYATAREEDDLNRRLAADAGSLLARVDMALLMHQVQFERANRVEAENVRLRAALDRVLQSPAIEYRSDPHLIVNPEGDQRELARAQETIKNANATRKPKRCPGTLGDRPSWMSEGQYSPCRCKLPPGHHGEHECEHTNPALATRDGEQ